MLNFKKSTRPINPTWFIIINISIAVLLLGAAVILKKSASKYYSGASINNTFISHTEAEENPEALRHSLIYTEAARSTAYRSILNITNSASITWILAALTLSINCMFILRMNRRHQLIMKQTTSA